MSHTRGEAHIAQVCTLMMWALVLWQASSSSSPGAPPSTSSGAPLRSVPHLKHALFYMWSLGTAASSACERHLSPAMSKALLCKLCFHPMRVSFRMHNLHMGLSNVCTAGWFVTVLRARAQEIYVEEGTLQALATLWRLPLLYLTVLGVRGLCILLLNPLFKLVGTGARRAELHVTTICMHFSGSPCAQPACC